MLAPTHRVGSSEQHEHLPGTLSLHTATLAAVATKQARDLARQGFTVVVVLSTNGGNDPAMAAAVAELGTSLPSVVVRAPHGDVGPNPGSHSGVWLTSVLPALRPDLVHLDHADGELAAELENADVQRGHELLERFIASIAADIRDQDASP